MSKNKLISFDLDNALYDNHHTLSTAEKVSQNYLKSEFIAQKKPFDYQKFFQQKNDLINCKAPAFDDLSLLRLTALKKFCHPLNNSEKIAEAALEKFIFHRSQVVIEPEIIVFLERLSRQFTLVSVSNGNCRIENTRLGKFFDKNYSPDKGFRAKPHPAMLNAAMQDFSMEKPQVIHLGDSIEKDGGAAENAGVEFLHLAPFEKTLDLADYLKEKLMVLEDFYNE